MKIVLGSDHRGFTLKQEIKKYLLEHNHSVVDVGDFLPTTPEDYPDIAESAAKKVLEHPENIGIIFCGSGVGILIAANKISGIRCGFGLTPAQVTAAKEDDDTNMLALASDYTSKDEAIALVDAMLSATFVPSENHVRRIEKITSLEKK